MWVEDVGVMDAGRDLHPFVNVSNILLATKWQLKQENSKKSCFCFHQLESVALWKILGTVKWFSLGQPLDQPQPTVVILDSYWWGNEPELVRPVENGLVEQLPASVSMKPVQSLRWHYFLARFLSFSGELWPSGRSSVRSSGSYWDKCRSNCHLQL